MDGVNVEKLYFFVRPTPPANAAAAASAKGAREKREFNGYAKFERRRSSEAPTEWMESFLSPFGCVYVCSRDNILINLSTLISKQLWTNIISDVLEMESTQHTHTVASNNINATTNMLSFPKRS